MRVVDHREIEQPDPEFGIDFSVGCQIQSCPLAGCLIENPGRIQSYSCLSPARVVIGKLQPKLAIVTYSVGRVHGQAQSGDALSRPKVRIRNEVRAKIEVCLKIV